MFSLHKFQFNTKQRKSFFTEISEMTNAGFSIIQACQKIIKIYKPSDVKVKFASEILDGFKNGYTKDVLQKWLPPAEAMIFTQILFFTTSKSPFKQIIKILEINNKIKSTLFSVVIPIFMILAVPILLYFSYGFFKTMSTVATVDPSVLNVTKIFHDNVIWFYILLICFMVMIAWILPNWKGKTRIHINQMPIFQTYLMIQCIGFFSALSGLLNTGMRLTDALTLIESQSPPATKEIYRGIMNDLSQGNNIGTALVSRKFPNPFIAKRISVLSDSKNIKEFFSTLSDEITETILSAIERNTSFMQIGIMILISMIFISLLLGVDFKSMQQ